MVANGRKKRTNQEPHGIQSILNEMCSFTGICVDHFHHFIISGGNSNSLAFAVQLDFRAAIEGNFEVRLLDWILLYVGM